VQIWQALLLYFLFSIRELVYEKLGLQAKPAKGGLKPFGTKKGRKKRA
jgi:hypothetical protein